MYLKSNHILCESDSSPRLHDNVLSIVKRRTPLMRWLRTATFEAIIDTRRYAIEEAPCLQRDVIMSVIPNVMHDIGNIESA